MVRRAHVLLHTKVNDPCPTAVIEAMACGSPSRIPRAAAPSSSWATRPGSGSPIRTARAGQAAGVEALAGVVSAILADREKHAGASACEGRSSGSRSPTGSSATRRSSASLVATPDETPDSSPGWA